MAKKKTEPFLDLVIDVFYSIILYNVFASFPGFKIESFLMIFSAFVIINYWWGIRSYEQYPKHNLPDYYFIVILMFLFSRWPSFYSNITMFLYITAIFFAIEGVWSLITVKMYAKSLRRNLRFFASGSLALAAIYILYSVYISSLNYLSIILIFLPYVAWFAINIKNKMFELKFTV